MLKTNKEFAIKTAVELAKINIQSTDKWITPEEVNYFMQEIYSFLTDEKGKE
ncbi:hypothetical protein [Cohnella boryungensis]|uniref:Uncharacterized protein n=1 Tax=Cohnella boryungensis TaxID=768479 RepID=A0ABV8SEU1_9BACL